jgi:predicted nucleic acid-binding protein
MSIVVLDSEAIEALATVSSNKHQRALAYIEADRGRRRRNAPGRTLLVPCTVRVEAGWDRTSPKAAVINRLGVVDHYLDQRTTNLAARLRRDLGVSPADAHIGAIVAEHGGSGVVVITSDPADIQKVAGATPVRICVL